jgi:ABC-2 type transport system permease protein
MIRTVIQISLMRLWHNKAELVLTFVVPIVFFSIFAWIFGSRGSGATPQLKIAICDQIESRISQSTIEILEASKSLRIHHSSNPTDGATKRSPMARSTAESLVRRGIVSAAIIFVGTSGKESVNDSGRIEIMADSFDQVAGQVITALVQKSSLTAQADLVSSLSKESRSPVDDVTIPAVALASTSNFSSSANGMLPVRLQPPSIEMIDVMGQKKSNPIIAMYASGIAVMFLLFSATTASGSLLDERENSTLERLLCSRMTMDHLLMGKWCYLVLIGVLQTTLMFVVGAVCFGLNLEDHFDGFAAMTIVSASAAASFALMLASICRTRTQLGWVSTIIILSMSALGGSMVPRYLMSEEIQRIGQFTFNAWALDGYNKVFWRELPLIELRNELAVLVVCAFVFIVIARVFATRWDRT